MAFLHIACLLALFAPSLTTWNYGYGVGNSGASFTVIKPGFEGVQPPYVIVKPSHSALRAGLSVFKPSYAGLKPEYKPDYISKPSYSGLKQGLQPMYLADGAKRRRNLKKLETNKEYKNLKKSSESDNHHKSGLEKEMLAKNSDIYVTQVNGNTGRVIRSYRIESLDQLTR